MKMTLISTVLNEGATIDTFLDSILSQTVLPDEIIIVDGGSIDGTSDILSSYESQFKDIGVSFKIFTLKGNRAVGRNYAVRKASYEHILCSDVGCELDKWWVSFMKKAFKRDVDVVGGYYYSFKDSDSIFQKCVGVYMSVMPDKLNQASFLPSSRSIGFTKAAWKSVGGYPEDLDTSEDLQFVRALKTGGAHFTTQKKALVYWPQSRSLLVAFLKFFKYARGDAEALYFRPNVYLLFVRYILFMILLMLNFFGFGMLGFMVIGASYFLWSIQKNIRYLQRHPLSIVLLPLIQVTADSAVMLGTASGVLTRILSRY